MVNADAPALDPAADTKAGIITCRVCKTEKSNPHPDTLIFWILTCEGILGKRMADWEWCCDECLSRPGPEYPYGEMTYAEHLFEILHGPIIRYNPPVMEFPIKGRLFATTFGLKV